MFRWLNKSAVW